MTGRIIALCGSGSMLDASVGSDWLRHALIARGLEVQRLDETTLPLADASFETVVCVSGLERVASTDVPQTVRELHRVTRRSAFIQVEIASGHDRAWWEAMFFESGFRRHPLCQTAVAYEALEEEGPLLTFVLEKIPAAALAAYPPAALKAERDLHMDMLREPGRRADAHLARYALAQEYLQSGDLVLDVACGLGYGSALLAHGAPAARVVGMDSSPYAINYARANFAPDLPNVEFQTGDVCRLDNWLDASVDVVVSFETLEHLPAPELLLREAWRVLKPGGRFIASVPNQWVDETGRDPNPWHFHVFDFAKLAALCEPFLALQEVYRQTAGGGMRFHDAPRALRRVQLPATSTQEEAEWWLVAAQVRKTRAPKVLASGRPNTIVALTPNPEHPIFATWLPDAPFPVEYATDAGLDFEFPAHTALVVAADTYHEPNVSLLRRAVEEGLPTLILADGILEYRNTWEHPQLAPGSIFQPVLGHKVACLGRSQARILETWGNAGKCEIIGAPRFDRYIGLKRRTRPAGAPFRVLVMTALTPYFTEEQHARVQQSLLDLKSFFAVTPDLCGAPLEAVWRLTKALDVEIGVSGVVSDLTGRELADVLQDVDAVITTPSTAMLEGMLLGLPVATLDYCNCPAYVPTAWRISASEHITPTIAELLDPSAPKMLFQETTLHDALECAAPAAPRLLRLVAEMIEGSLPIGPMEAGHAEPAAAEDRFPLEAFYPGHAPFRETNISALQVEVGHLREYAADLERRLRDSRAELACISRPEPPPSDRQSGLELAFAFLDHLAHAHMVRGGAEQLAEWGATIDGKFERTIFLHPPAEVRFEIPVGEAGQLRTAVTLHPDVWERPGSVGCEFCVRVDGRVALVLALDPVRVPADRRWHEVQLDVPASASGWHQVSIETRGIGSSEFRWAICREPRFTWCSPIGGTARALSPQPALT